jgi:hypothetical protein
MTDADRDAARVTLLAVCTALPGDQVELPQAVVLAPGEQELSWEEASEKLANLAKPLECRGQRVSGRLILSCSSISKAGQSTLRYQLDDLNQHEGPIGALADDFRGGVDPVLVVGRGSSLLVRYGALDAWTRSYVVAMPLGISSRDPGVQERALGARSVVEFGRVDDVTIEVIGARC